MRRRIPVIDVGLVWAKIVNIWGQVGTVAGIVNFVMMLGVFYTTTVYPNIKIPIWLYLFIVIIGASLVIGFIIKWGISGYFRYFSNLSEITKINNKVCDLEKNIDLIMKHFNIDEKK